MVVDDVGGPDAGERTTVGTGGTVKVEGDVPTPDGVVTVTGPVVASTGTVAVTWV
jgi:hypothetical protein